MIINETKKEKLRNIITDEAKKHNVVGLSLYITDEKENIFLYNYGVTSAENPSSKITENTLFKVASNTKMTTSFIGLILRERGELDFKEKVRYYLPWFDLCDDITVENLLSHTAGLPTEYTPDGERDEDRLEEVLKKGLSKVSLIYEPSKGYNYSNWGYRLLSLIYQKITGKVYSKLNEELVLNKLNMNNSTFDIQKAMTFPFALPHDENKNVLHKIEINATRYAAGGLISSALDMSKLARCLINGGYPLVSKESFDYMCKRISKTQTGYYGLGMQEFDYKGKRMIGHGGDNNPYFSTTKVIPSEKIGLGVLCNTGGIKQFVTTDLPYKVFDILFE